MAMATPSFPCPGHAHRRRYSSDAELFASNHFSTEERICPLFLIFANSKEITIPLLGFRPSVT